VDLEGRLSLRDRGNPRHLLLAQGPKIRIDSDLSSFLIPVKVRRNLNVALFTTSTNIPRAHGSRLIGRTITPMAVALSFSLILSLPSPPLSLSLLFSSSPDEASFHRSRERASPDEEPYNNVTLRERGVRLAQRPSRYVTASTMTYLRA